MLLMSPLFPPGKVGKLLKGCCLLPPSISFGGGGRGGVKEGAVWESTAEQWEEEQMKDSSEDKKTAYGNVGHMAICAG